ncbi:uncharacterized protein LOC114357427 [Ostrinia furnacalis]|uniref:uncharacterized protein LOC114357427 n=1 Tax=Ostrinia furnacalis TaxID=93504 RepID=UPI00103E5B7A|nr:uncharacterized protein LOC114357427 [Ostrinia furnacalis]
MWQTIIAVFFITTINCRYFISKKNTSMFKNEQIIFASDFNITKLLVPADGSKYIQTESSEIPSIFFAISDSKLEGGSCIYVLEGFAAYEILEGGRDATADYSFSKTIFFGARDGIYKYYPDSLSAKKYGPFRDDIIQLQKANGSDAIFILTSDHRIYKIEKNGTVKTRVQSIPCAFEFVLDTSNNIYYLACDDHMPHIVKSDGRPLSFTASVIEDFKDIKLIRPAFIMEGCVPFFGDGHLYLLYANGTSEKKDFYLDEKPTAFSVDAALYLVAALDGKIYEFNVMEVLLRSMFGLATEWPRDVTKIVMSIIDSARESIHGFHRGWNYAGVL